MERTQYSTCIILSAILLVSMANGNPSRVHNLLRSRRETATETSAMSSTPPTSMSTLSGHASHNITCDGDSSELAKSCPDKDTCPTDNETMEKCCHCLKICCSPDEPSSTSSPGSDIGEKVKGAISSAEGWLKNAGQSIKNGWDKAKESVKQTAEDVKEKVKKGVNTAVAKVRNATAAGNCTDGQCASNMSSDSSTQENNSSENPTTPVPGYKKMKRDIYSSRVARQPTLFERITSEDSDSSELSWTKTTTTTTGTRDTNRRYRRQSQQNNNDTMSASSSNSTSSSNGDTKRNRRTAGDCNSTSVTHRMKRAAPNESSASSTLPPMASSTAGTNSGKDRTRRGAGSDMRMGATEKSQGQGITPMPSGSTTGRSNYRNRRQATDSTPTMATMSPGMSSSTTPSVGATGNMNVSSPGRVSDTAKNKNNSIISFAIHVLDTRANGRDNSSIPSYFITNTGNASSSSYSGQSNIKGMYLPIEHPIQPSADAPMSGTSPPNVAFPVGNGDLSASPSLLIPNSNGALIGGESDNRDNSVFMKKKLQNDKAFESMNYGSSLRDNMYYLLLTTPSTSMLTTSLEGAQIGNDRDKVDENLEVETLGNIYPVSDGQNVYPEHERMDQIYNNRNENNTSLGKPGECQPLAAGLRCVPLSPSWPQCVFDSDCVGSKKCCFYACDPYRNVGICEDAVASTPSII